MDSGHRETPNCFGLLSWSCRRPSSLPLPSPPLTRRFGRCCSTALVLSCFVLLVLWAVLRPDRSAEAKAGWDASQWLFLGLELAGLVGLVLGFGTFLLAEAMTFVEVVVAVLVLYLLVDHFVPRSFRLTLALPGLILGGYTVLESGEWPIYLALWVVSWGVFFLYNIIQRIAPRFFLQAIPVRALREGMVPRLAVCAADKDGTEEYYCGAEVGQGQDMLCYAGRPLTKGQVRTLHEKSARGSFAQFGNELEVELAVPFAPIIAVAGVLTVVLGGSLNQAPDPVIFSLAAVTSAVAGGATMNRDRKDPVTLAFGVLLVALVPTFFLLASRYQSLDERVRQLQPKPFVPAPSPEALLAQVSQVVSDSTLQLQPVWVAEPEPTSGLVAGLQRRARRPNGLSAGAVPPRYRL